MNPTRLLALMCLFVSGTLCRKNEPYKENESPALRPFEILINHSKGGLKLHEEPEQNSRVRTTIPYGASLLVSDKKTFPHGPIDDRVWFQTVYQGQGGWVNGKYVQSSTAIIPKGEFGADYSKFIGGCFNEGCDLCNGIIFRPDRSVYFGIGCHYGKGTGTWYTGPKGIYATVTYYPTCYDDCLKGSSPPDNDAPLEAHRKYSKAMADYTERHKHTVKFRFFMNPDNSHDYEIIGKSLKDEMPDLYPKKPLGPLVPYMPPS